MSRFSRLKRGAAQEAAVVTESGYTRQPLFVGGMDGVQITPTPPTATRPNAWVRDHREMIKGYLDQHGVVLIRGLNLMTPQAFSEVFENLIGPTISYDHRMTERTEVAAGNVYTSTDYPPAQTLPMHHEFSFHRRVVKTIAFFCVTPSKADGATPVGDGFTIYEALPQAIRTELEERELLYVRNTGSPITLSWQDAYQTDQRDAVEAYCKAEGIEFLWRDNGELQTKVRQPAFLTHPSHGRRTFCNHLHLLHRSQAYPKQIHERFFADTQGLDLPYHVLFGDGEEIPDETVQIIGDTYARHANRFQWQVSDLLLLDNLRVVHGRDRFEGERQIQVVMSGLHDRTSVP